MLHKCKCKRTIVKATEWARKAGGSLATVLGCIHFLPIRFESSTYDQFERDVIHVLRVLLCHFCPTLQNLQKVSIKLKQNDKLVPPSHKIPAWRSDNTFVLLVKSQNPNYSLHLVLPFVLLSLSHVWTLQR